MTVFVSSGHSLTGGTVETEEVLSGGAIVSTHVEQDAYVYVLAGGFTSAAQAEGRSRPALKAQQATGRASRRSGWIV